MLPTTQLRAKVCPNWLIPTLLMTFASESLAFPVTKPTAGRSLSSTRRNWGTWMPKGPLASWTVLVTSTCPSKPSDNSTTLTAGTQAPTLKTRGTREAGTLEYQTSCTREPRAREFIRSRATWTLDTPHRSMSLESLIHRMQSQTAILGVMISLPIDPITS